MVKWGKVVNQFSLCENEARRSNMLIGGTLLDITRGRYIQKC